MKEFEKISAEELERVMKLSDDELAAVSGGTNWPCFGACMLSHGAGAIPALTEIVNAIRAKNWNKVSG